MIRLLVFRKKIKLYGSSILNNKNEFLKYLKIEIEEWNVIAKSSKDNRFFPIIDLSVFIGFNILKPAEKLFFVKDFSIYIKETKKGVFLFLLVNFQNLLIFLFLLFLVILAIVSYQFLNNNIKPYEIYNLMYGLSVAFIIYSVFYIKASMKFIIIYISKLIEKFYRLRK